MRVAKQQAQDLDQAHNYLSSMIAPEGSPSKLQPPTGELSGSRMSNGRVRPSRGDPATRFGDPPAPPPQQPLPEKPDSLKGSPINSVSLSNMLKRSDTTKPTTNGSTQSPTGQQSSQILSLVSALEIAKKELDSQNTHIQQLEDMLKQERTAREAAEERARKIEATSSARPIKMIEEDESTDDEVDKPALVTGEAADPIVPDEQLLQQKLESMVAEMQRMRNDIEQANKRADTAEKDANNARSSLAEMIERIKKENESTSDEHEQASQLRDSDLNGSADLTEIGEGSATRSKHGSRMANGHVRTPSRLPHAVESVMATVLRENYNSGEVTAQSAPYVSMVGVVLIGVGLMAYLNSWQKGDK